MGLYKAYSPAGGTGVGATKLRETRPKIPERPSAEGFYCPARARAAHKIPVHEVQRDFPGLRCQPPARLRTQLFRLVRNAPKAEAAKRKGKARTYAHCTPWRMVPATAVSGSL